MKVKIGNNQGELIKISDIKKENRVVTLGVLLMISALLIAGGYLLIKPKAVEKKEVKTSQETLKPGETKEFYLNEKFGYTLTYDSQLTPRELKSENYLNFVIFLAPARYEKSGFGVSVRENLIEEEIAKVKEEIGQAIEAVLVSESEEEAGGNRRYRMEYEPKVDLQGEKKTVVIINNGQYSYTISSNPKQIEEIISDFRLLK